MTPVHKAYSVKESADLLNIHPQTVYKLVNKGDIRSVRVGRAIRIPLREIQRLNGMAKECGCD